MASHGHQMHSQAAPRYAPAPQGGYGGGGRGYSHGHGQPSYTSPPPQTVAAPGVVAPAGTFAPGTKIQVGGHRVVIQKYLSEGGFAHVYVVKLPKPIDGTDLAVLKRVAVPDKEALRGMRTEVETMKRLKGHRMIVTYIDSHASEMRGGGYEVFLLMEYCSGGGLIDFMNTRLQHRLTEPEILNIFCDIAEGLACMHYLKPPLLHRDLKIENVLITRKGSSKRFKLCDFGSAASPKPAPTTVVECRIMDEDIQKHTTLQYRSPEMIDVYRKQPMNEKIDIWALGVFLYKLCYYTTPFEDQGQLAILNVSYRFPSSPPFSDRLKKLIASMLRENMESRPNVYQVLKEACAMQGRDVPIKDIYSERSKSDSSRPPSLPPKDDISSQPAVGAVFSPPVEEKPHIPEVTPMRRGRPTAPTAPTASMAPKSPSQPPAKPQAASVTKGDPFAALDSKSPPLGGETDEFSARFPSLDQFSLLHDQGSKFDFDSTQPAPPAKPSDTLSQKVTERLADDAFVTSRQNTPPVSRPHSRPQSVTPAPPTGTRVIPQYGEQSPAKPSPAPLRQEVSRAQTIISSNPELQAISTHTTSRYVSTGTSTDDLPYEQPLRNLRRVSQGPASDMPRSASAPRNPSATGEQVYSPEPHRSVSSRINSLQVQPAQSRPQSTSPALEPTLSPPDLIDVVPRTNISVNRSRPVSTNLENSTIDFLREKEIQSNRPTPSPRPSPQIPSPNLIPAEDDEPKVETSDLEFLRSMEDPKSTNKRSSLTSLSGSKNMLSGRFGDAFKLFESSNQQQPSGGRSPSPLKDQERRDLTPIAGSEATDGRSDDGRVENVLDGMTPERRREMERRKLEEEEQRVEAAQAEYRKRVAEGGTGTGPTPLPRSIGGVPRALSIQNRVQSLLSEEQKPANHQRTAQGYGKYTDESPTEPRRPEIARKPVAGPKPQLRGSPALGISSTGPPTAPSTAPRPPGKPVAPKKPGHLNSLPTGSSIASPTKISRAPTEQLVAVDLPGQPALDMSAEDKDNYIRDFAQRFPSLSALETPESGGGRR